MFSAKELAMVVIVLKADLGKLARIKGQVWRDSGSLAAEDVIWVVSAMVAVGPFPTQTADPTRLETPQHLRIKTPVPQSLRRERRYRIDGRFETLVERLGL